VDSIQPTAPSSGSGYYGLAHFFRFRKGQRTKAVKWNSSEESFSQTIDPAPLAKAYATAPNSQPIPAVTAIAKPPQNVTRSAPGTMLAPPARADRAPRSASSTSDDPETSGINPATGATDVTMRDRKSVV
jgi:hypothetical protein